MGSKKQEIARENSKKFSNLINSSFLLFTFGFLYFLWAWKDGNFFYELHEVCEIYGNFFFVKMQKNFSHSINLLRNASGRNNRNDVDTKFMAFSDLALFVYSLILYIHMPIHFLIQRGKFFCVLQISTKTRATAKVGTKYIQKIILCLLRSAS